MRGIEKIVNQIMEEGNVKKVEIETDAKMRAEEIMREAELSGKEAEKEIIDKVLQQIADYEQVDILSGEQKKRRAILTAKQDAISSVLKESYERIIDLDKDEYFELLKDMLKKFMLPQEGQIIFNKRDVERMPVKFMEEVVSIANSINGKITISSENREIDGGFILIYGGIEENCTFKALFEGKKEELHDLIKDELFQ